MNITEKFLKQMEQQYLAFWQVSEHNRRKQTSRLATNKHC